jgi:UDP-N-acetylglucosamine pyrophosphorylase
MTSDDTNALTINLLESNSYFGMEPSQVKILKQVVFYFAFSTMWHQLILVLTNSYLF